MLLALLAKLCAALPNTKEVVGVVHPILTPQNKPKILRVLSSLRNGKLPREVPSVSLCSRAEPLSVRNLCTAQGVQRHGK